MDLVATLPWTSPLALVKSRRRPWFVARPGKKLVAVLFRMSLGEKVALARRVHARSAPVDRVGDRQVLVALLDNQRLSENDVLLILNTAVAPEFTTSSLAIIAGVSRTPCRAALVGATHRCRWP
jgi:DNA-binding GntR family transcriptional regulator